MIKPSGVLVQEPNSLNVPQCSLRWAELTSDWDSWSDMPRSELENSQEKVVQQPDLVKTCTLYFVFYQNVLTCPDQTADISWVVYEMNWI